MSDSGFFLDVQDDTATPDSASYEHPGFSAALRWAYDAMELQGDESCVAHYGAVGEAWRCGFAEYTLPFIDTPTFLVNSKYDAWSLLAAGSRDAGRVPNGGILMEREPESINSGWGNWFNERLRAGLEQNAGHAAFITACEYHCNLWTEVKIGGLTPAAAFMQWYTDGAAALPSRLLDDGATFPCEFCCSTALACEVGLSDDTLLSLVPATAAPPPAAGDKAHFGPGVHEIVLPNGTARGRRFLLAIPKKLPSPPSRVPAIIDWHGYSESPHYQNVLTGMAATADAFGWLAIIPFGTAPTPSESCCPTDCDQTCCQTGAIDHQNPCSWNAGAGGCCGAAVAEAIDDVGFARAIAMWLETNTMFDPENLFATGFSNGAMLANRLGCEAADLFKAICPVEGNLQLGEFGTQFERCSPTEGVAWLGFCGTSDSVCEPDFDHTAAKWATLNNCDPTPHTSFASGSTRCTVWHGCEGSPAHFVEKCWVEGLRHEWSGHVRPDGESPLRPAADIDATQYIFKRLTAVAAMSRSVYRLGSSQMKLIGHRGASATQPENTRAAFESALAAGADGVECDLHMLRDGKIIVLHDDTLRRTATNGRAALLDTNVSTLDWADISAIEVGGVAGAGEQLLSFKDFLGVVGRHGRRRAFVELKGGDSAVAAPAAAAAAAAAGVLAPDLLTWISFDLQLLLAMKRLLPEYAVYLVAGPEDEVAARVLVEQAAAAGLDGIDLAAIPAIVTPAVIDYAHSFGLAVGVWVDSAAIGRLDVESSWRRFAAAGADFFTTNLPPMLFEVFERRPKRR